MRMTVNHKAKIAEMVEKMLKKAGLDERPSLEEVQRRPFIPMKMRVKNIAFLDEKANILSSRKDPFLAEAVEAFLREGHMKQKNKYHTMMSSIDMDRNMSMSVFPSILAEGMYQPIVVGTIPGNGTVFCVSGRNRLTVSAIIYGWDARIEVLMQHYESAAEMTRAIDFWNQSRTRRPVEKSIAKMTQIIDKGETNIMSNVLGWCHMAFFVPEMLDFNAPKFVFGAPRISTKQSSPAPMQQGITQFAQAFVCLRSKGVFVSKDVAEKKRDEIVYFLNQLHGRYSKIVEVVKLKVEGIAADCKSRGIACISDDEYVEWNTRLHQLTKGLNDYVFAAHPAHAIGRLMKHLKPDVASEAWMTTMAEAVAKACASIIVGSPVTGRDVSPKQFVLLAKRVIREEAKVAEAIMKCVVPKQGSKMTEVMMMVNHVSKADEASTDPLGLYPDGLYKAVKNGAMVVSAVKASKAARVSLVSKVLKHEEAA